MSAIRSCILFLCNRMIDNKDKFIGEDHGDWQIITYQNVSVVVVRKFIFRRVELYIKNYTPTKLNRDEEAELLTIFGIIFPDALKRGKEIIKNKEDKRKKEISDIIEKAAQELGK